MLSGKDSNPERQDQNLLCYHYTTGHRFGATKVVSFELLTNSFQKKLQNNITDIYTEFTNRLLPFHANNGGLVNA